MAYRNSEPQTPNARRASLRVHLRYRPTSKGTRTRHESRREQSSVTAEARRPDTKPRSIMVNHVLFTLVRSQNDRPPLPHHERYGTAASAAKRTFADLPKSAKCRTQTWRGTWPAREPGALLLGMKMRRAALHLWCKAWSVLALKSLRPQQGVDQVTQQPGSDERGE